MKKQEIRIALNTGHRSVLGYYIGDGLLAVFNAEGWEGGWVVTHVPTGAKAVSKAFETFEAAKNYAVNIRKVEPFDWSTKDTKELQAIPGFVWDHIYAVGMGELSPEEFNVKVMKYKMKVS